MKSVSLTKKNFMAFPTGLFLVSGVGQAPGCPCFGEVIEPEGLRHCQWERVVKAGASGGRTLPFQDEAEHKAFCQNAVGKAKRV